jgi:hypothetical protein
VISTDSEPKARTSIPEALDLRAGEWVEVRSAEEILGTLDETHALEGLPFQPEMLQYCGRRFRVYKSAHKTCDTIELYLIRKMDRTVHLEDLRCDGAAHGGCQAGCLIYWKEAWLKRVPDDVAQTVPLRRADAASLPGAAFQALTSAQPRPQPGTPEPLYRCQATDMLKATAQVRRRERWDPRFYVKDLTSRNVTVGQFLGHGLRAAFNAFLVQWCGWRFPRVKGLAPDKTPTESLNLQPGELVQVRSKEEIMRTLNRGMKNRGLWFDIEMVPFCNEQYRVLRRVDTLVDEKNGKLLKLSNPCLILEGVTCSGCMSSNRMFCSRAIFPYWREIWLKRVAPAGQAR